MNHKFIQHIDYARHCINCGIIVVNNNKKSKVSGGIYNLGVDSANIVSYNLNKYKINIDIDILCDDYFRMNFECISTLLKFGHSLKCSKRGDLVNFSCTKCLNIFYFNSGRWCNAIPPFGVNESCDLLVMKAALE